MDVLGEEHPYNTAPQDYIVDLAGRVRTIPSGDYTPSRRVALALQATDSRITTKGFRKAVTEAIFADTVEQEYPNKNYRERFVRRLDKWTQKKSKATLLDRCEILESWRKRDSRFVPDAYLVDKKHRTVVCYEIEDRHPLNPFSVGAYAAAWWTLEYIYWDLHLIAYDIYGNHRVIIFPESGFLAHEVRAKRMAPLA